MGDEAERNDPSSSPFPSKPTAKQQLVRFACIFFNILCGFTNGYDICVTTVFLDSLVHDFNLCGTSETDARVSFSDKQLRQPGNSVLSVESCVQKQAIMSLSAVGSLIAKLSLPWVADRFGRRCGLACVDVLIIASVILQISATSSSIFFCGRFVLGMAMGFAFVVEPSYLCEIAPPKRRGMYVVLNELSVCVGCLVGLQVAAGLLMSAGIDSGVWRLATVLGGAPALVQLAFLSCLPESPRWLALKGHAEQLEAAAATLGIAGSELAGLQQALESHYSDTPKMQTKLEMLSSECRKHIKACQKSSFSFLLSLCVAFFATASGAIAMQAYAFDILGLSGIQHPRALLPIIGWMKLAGALLAVALADVPQIGRRRLALYSGFACCICDITLVLRFAFPESLPPNVAAFAFFTFIFVWNSGYGGVQFAATLEMLPNEVRSVWAGQIFAINGVVEILIYQLFELLLFQNAIAPFLLFAAVNFCGGLFATFVMPDLHGHSLEVSVTKLVDAPIEIHHSSASSPRRRASVSATSTAAASKVTALARGPKARRYGKLTEEREAKPSPNRPIEVADEDEGWSAERDSNSL